MTTIPVDLLTRYSCMATQDTLTGSNEARTLYIVRSPEAELAHLWIDKVP